MDRTPIVAEGVPAAAGPYSSGIRYGDVVYLSGQGPYRSDGTLSGSTIAEQTRQTLSNLEVVAEAAGTSLSQAVRLGVFLSSMSHFAEMNEVYAQFFSEPYPARTTVQVGLPKSEMLVEIDAIVAVPRRSS